MEGLYADVHSTAWIQCAQVPSRFLMRPGGLMYLNRWIRNAERRIPVFLKSAGKKLSGLVEFGWLVEFTCVFVSKH
jgi:hypothetical protein